MANPGTVANLMNLAIQAERNAEALYDRFSAMFIEHPEVAAFWSMYANEEAGHARWMVNLMARTPESKLAGPADMKIYEMAERLTSISLDDLVAGIGNLEQAWELANEMEHGETNTIFEFLIGNFADDEKTVAFLRAQLAEHLSHLLINFPLQFRDAGVKRGIRPRTVVAQQ